MVGGESSGPETGRGDQDEIHHHVVDDVPGQDGPAGGGPRLPSASGIDGDNLPLLPVSEVVGLRGADADSLHQQRPAHLLDVPGIRHPGRELVPRSFGVVVRRAHLHRLLEQNPRSSRGGGLSASRSTSTDYLSVDTGARHKCRDFVTPAERLAARFGKPIIRARARSLLCVPTSSPTQTYNEEDFMPATTGRTKRSEKGLLTPDNCVVTLIDHQPQMMFGVAGVDRESIINHTVALGKAARVFDVPVVLTTVETKSFSGNLWPQIRAVFPEQTAIERSSMNAWDDKNFVAAIKATGRKKLVLAGLWTEVCVAFPSVQAIHDGYEVYVVEDCCGDVSQLAHDNAMKRVIQAGAKPVTSLQVMLEFQRDWAEKDTYDAVMDIVKTHYGAYGVGVEYVYTMVHHAPPTVFPKYVIPSATSHK